MNNKLCDFIEKCPVANYFGQTGWSLTARRYCHEGLFDQCQRRQLRLSGQPVPDHLFPWDNTQAGASS